MKHRASIELDLTNGDVFEQEVVDSMKAFAKTIARESFQKEIQDEIIDTAKTWTKRLYESRYTPPLTEEIIKEITQSYIKKQMSHEDVLDMIGETVSNEMKKCQDEVNKYVHAEVERVLTSSFITNMIQKEIEKAVPQAVLEVLMKAGK